jgi:hypothetical protein
MTIIEVDGVRALYLNMNVLRDEPCLVFLP